MGSEIKEFHRDRFRIWGWLWKWQFGRAHEIVWSGIKVTKSNLDLRLVPPKSDLRSATHICQTNYIFSLDRLFLEFSNQDHLRSDSWECGLSGFFLLSAFLGPIRNGTAFLMANERASFYQLNVVSDISISVDQVC